MFCVNCGSEIKTGLNYCNRCGARVGNNDNSIDRPLSISLSSSLGAIGVFGLVGYIFVALIILKNGAEGSLIFVSLIYFAALFGICFLILQQIKALPGRSKDRFQDNNQSVELGRANTAQLDAPRQSPISSVTDHTTRTLDEAAIERK